MNLIVMGPPEKPKATLPVMGPAGSLKLDSSPAVVEPVAPTPAPEVWGQWSDPTVLSGPSLAKHGGRTRTSNHGRIEWTPTSYLGPNLIASSMAQLLEKLP